MRKFCECLASRSIKTPKQYKARMTMRAASQGSIPGIDQCITVTHVLIDRTGYHVYTRFGGNRTRGLGEKASAFCDPKLKRRTGRCRRAI